MSKVTQLAGSLSAANASPHEALVPLERLNLFFLIAMQRKNKEHLTQRSLTFMAQQHLLRVAFVAPKSYEGQLRSSRPTEWTNLLSYIQDVPMKWVHSLNDVDTNSFFFQAGLLS